MKDQIYRYSGQTFKDIDIHPVNYCDDFFYKELEMESSLFYELRKNNNMKPFRIIESSDEELEEIKDYFTKNKENFYFVINGNDIIGSILIIDNYIQSFCINSKYQRQGYGNKLIKFAINDIINRKKYKYVELSILPGNSIAEKFYSKIGFEKVE